MPDYGVGTASVEIVQGQGTLHLDILDGAEEGVALLLPDYPLQRSLGLLALVPHYQSTMTQTLAYIQSLQPRPPSIQLLEFGSLTLDVQRPYHESGVDVFGEGLYLNDWQVFVFLVFPERHNGFEQ